MIQFRLWLAVGNRCKTDLPVHSMSDSDDNMPLAQRDHKAPVQQSDDEDDIPLAHRPVHHKPSTNGNTATTNGLSDSHPQPVVATAAAAPPVASPSNEDSSDDDDVPLGMSASSRRVCNPPQITTMAFSVRCAYAAQRQKALAAQKARAAPAKPAPTAKPVPRKASNGPVKQKKQNGTAAKRRRAYEDSDDDHDDDDDDDPPPRKKRAASASNQVLCP